MRKLFLFNSNSGFSLIELMTVVAIISILVTLGMPNFMRFRSKARQIEAKANLSTLFAAEKGFYAEWGAYTGDFRDIGLMVTGKLKYDIGFSSAGYQPPAPFTNAASDACGARTAFNTEVSACALDNKSFQASVIFRPAPASGGCKAGSDPTITGFRATAIGVIIGDRTNTPDIWTIDEVKTVCNNQDGTF
jgi:type IV pilus assembly protein PilA